MRRDPKHSRILTWYYGLPMQWSSVIAYWRARIDGARTARMIRDMNEAPTVEMPRISGPAPAGRHALREPSRLTPLAGEGALS